MKNCERSKMIDVLQNFEHTFVIGGTWALYIVYLFYAERYSWSKMSLSARIERVAFAGVMLLMVLVACIVADITTLAG